jgi:hypothetical protein
MKSINLAGADMASYGSWLAVAVVIRIRDW